jgi:hypothetical protein
VPLSGPYCSPPKTVCVIRVVARALSPHPLWKLDDERLFSVFLFRLLLRSNRQWMRATVQTLASRLDAALAAENNSH